MSKEQKQYIFVGILAVVLVGVLAYQLTRKPAAPASAKKAGTTTTTSTPAPTPKPSTPVTGAALALTEGDGPIDIDSLLAQIEEVDFDYQRERVKIDPMKPLVGTIAKRRVTTGEGEGEGEEQGGLGELIAWVMNCSVSGILWDTHFPLAVVDYQSTDEDAIYNEVVHPGYKYPNGVVIHQIQQDRVIFMVGDYEVEVQLKEQ